MEFGSDFHFVSCGLAPKAPLFPSAVFYADGRQALIHLCQTWGWKRIWVPEYFCYEVLASWQAAGLNLVFYPDYPGADDESAVRSIAFQEGDALLRVNYFGMRLRRSNAGIPVPVVEDHTHDLVGDWASGSDADYCLASLRKTLPVAEGGVLWSPRGCPLPPPPAVLLENESVAGRRWEAMRMKSQYLAGDPVEKAAFRQVFLETEAYFDTAPVSSLDARSQAFLQDFDIASWYAGKRRNFEAMTSLESRHFTILAPEGEACYPFSLVVLCESAAYRDQLRRRLIADEIYPAVLWSIPPEAPVSEAARSFACRMLSLHCDGRYSLVDMQLLQSRIEAIVSA